MDLASNMDFPVGTIAKDVGFKALITLAKEQDFRMVLPIDLIRFGGASILYSLAGSKMMEKISAFAPSSKLIGKTLEKVLFLSLYNSLLSMVVGSPVNILVEVAENGVGFTAFDYVEKGILNKT